MINIKKRPQILKIYWIDVFMRKNFNFKFNLLYNIIQELRFVWHIMYINGEASASTITSPEYSSIQNISKYESKWT